MFTVMSNSTDIIIVAKGNVRQSQSIGFKIESKHNSYDSAFKSALLLEGE